ncbi:MAG: DUF6249 domain-containing protein [Draconibacterium sp.]
MEHLSEIVITVVVFAGIYYILSLLADFLLKRKLIKAQQYERVGILDTPKPTTEEVNKYPSLKWGLVAFMAGLGLIVIEWLRYYDADLIDYRNSVLPFGILLVFVSLGFLIYFFIMNGKKK